MKKRMLAVMFSILLMITGCASNIQGQDLMKDVKAEDIKLKTDLSEGREEITDFAVRLFQASEEKGKNTLISPMSVLCALAMTANGAKEDTLEQMEQVLGMPAMELNDYLYSYLKKLPQGKDYKLHFANSIWFTDHEDFTVNQDFLQLNANYYGADIYKAPFDHTTLKDINRWVKNETDGMIPEILDQIPREAVMYLVNALAFEAEWAKDYKEHQVRDGKFTLEDGDSQSVTFMYGTEGDYLEDENATGFLKYYKDGKYAFAALLPKENINVSDYIATLNGENLNKLITNRKNAIVNTAIPKFESEYNTEMSKTLSKMGMVDAFNAGKADFKGLGSCKEGNIYINRVIHKTFISVGEKGTKAGAATAVEMKNESAAIMTEEPKKVYLDRPFVYMLIDCETNIPFFIGTMMEPISKCKQSNEDMGESVKAEYKDGDVNMSLQIPEGWEYDIVKPGEIEYEDAGIHFWPKGEKSGRLKLTYQGSGWGVCGTGLKEKQITLGNYAAVQGNYDNQEVWTFICFTDVPDTYVVLNEGADHWWGAFGAEAMEILSTVQIGEN